MNRRQKESIEAYGRVQAFLADHPLPAPATYGAPQRTLDEVVAWLSGHAITQSEGTREYLAATRGLRARYRELRKQHLHPIAVIARGVMREAPGMEVALRYPKGTISVTRLIADAQAIRNAAARREPAFVENGRPADFLTQLDAAVVALQRALLTRAQRNGERVAARRAIEEGIRHGRNAVEMLDAVVRTHFAGDPFVLAQWRSARRLVAAPTAAPTAAKQPTPPAHGGGKPPVTPPAKAA